MGKNNTVCPKFGRKMKQKLIGFQHRKCGMKWKKEKAIEIREMLQTFTETLPVIRCKRLFPVHAGQDFSYDMAVSFITDAENCIQGH